MPENQSDVVELEQDPLLIEEEDRTIVSAASRTVQDKHPVQVTVWPLGPGIYVPHRSGDKLGVQIIRGRKLMGIHPVCSAVEVVPPQSMRNLELRGTRGGNLVLAPDRDDEGSDVLLGRETRNGANYQRVMLFDKLSADVLALKGMLDACGVIEAHVAALNAADLISHTAGTIWRAAQTSYDAINGGEPGVGVKAAK